MPPDFATINAVILMKKKTREKSRKAAHRKEARRGRRIYSLLQGLFLGFCICLLLFTVWKIGAAFLARQAAAKEYSGLKQYILQEPPPPGAWGDEAQSSVQAARIDLASLQDINPDAAGWIEIPGSGLSYPIVHASDNAYYLTHTFRRKKNNAGSIFIETASKADLSDLHTIIYGKSGMGGSMFAGLKDYKKEKYRKAHPYVFIDLEDGSHCYEIFSCHNAPVTDISYTIGYKKDQTYAAFLEELKASSLYDTGVAVGAEDSVITLSTYIDNKKDRFVVHARKIY